MQSFTLHRHATTANTTASSTRLRSRTTTAASSHILFFRSPISSSPCASSSSSHALLILIPREFKVGAHETLRMATEKGKRRPCRKSLYVPRVNGFFSDGVNSRVPTTDAVWRWGLGWIILIPSFLGVNVLSVYLFFYVF